MRACPSQAIAVNRDTVRIVEESCIRAGNCVPACPHSAIDAVGDFSEALALAKRGDAVVVLSVEAEVHFHPSTPEQVVNACYEAGFQAVHRGVLGDELVAEEYRRLLGDPAWGTMIRSTCPVVVERIRHGFPELVPYLAPVKTPLAAEAAYLRRLYGPEVGIVYAGVCNAEANGDVDAIITFDELAGLLKVRGVDVTQQPRHFHRVPEVRQRHLSTAGGLPLPVLALEPQTSRRFRKVRGMRALDVIARAVAVDQLDLGFVDLLPCEGCLDHPLMGPREELYRRRRLAQEAEPPRSPTPVVDPAVPVKVGAAFGFIHNGKRPSKSELDEVIDKIGRASSGAHWDCGACGYGTCVNFAVALLSDRATLRQCPPYQERRALEARLQAAVDELTGLATYRVLQGRLQEEIARSHRNREPFGVLFLDLDRFKQVNDQHGHEAGNRVLSAVGHELKRVVRKTDVAARYGGDEFVVVLVGTGPGGTTRVAEVLREAVEGVGRELGHDPGVVTVSVGAAAYNPETGLPPDVLDASDKALYRAKAAGGNQVVVGETGEDGEFRLD
ncbi:MAG: diguanylate cyclase [Gemmatimonadales bacterium]|nr:diguanylate cyclase [Gemmatimonadales bacterium]NIS66899.1 diguanylate cyclase [Gemmatimonadales bacterium]